MADGNVFSSFAAGAAQGAQQADSAFNSAGNWATQQAQLKIHQQQVEQQQQQIDEYKKQADVKMGETMFDHLDQYAKQTNPVLQKLKGKQIQQFAQTAGVQFDPGILEGLKNDDLKGKFFAAAKVLMDPTNPKEFNEKMFGSLVEQFGSADALTRLQNYGKARADYLASKQRTDAMANKPPNPVVNSREKMRAQSDFNSQFKDAKTRLEGASRIRGIFEQAASGKIKTNQAFKSLIDSEVVRLETGASNPAFGLQQQRDMHTTAEALGEFLQKVKGAPRDTVPKPILNQLDELTKELTKSYQHQANSAYDVLAAGATPNQKPIIDEKFAAFKKTYQDRFGYWHEPDGTLSKSERAAAKQAKSASASATAAPAAPAEPSPKDIQEAMRVRAAWAKETDPDVKAKIAQKAQQVIPPALRQKVGLP